MSGGGSPRRSMRRRAGYLGLALLTIAVGLLVHFHGEPLGPVARDVLGDALWATMIFWGTGVLLPATSLRTRGTLAVLFCFAVELGQLVRSSGLDAVRGTTIGHLVLGSDFDPRDLVAYALGVALGCLLERAVRGRRTPRSGR